MFTNILKSAAAEHKRLHTALVRSSDRTLYINVVQEQQGTTGSSMFADLASTGSKPDRYGPFKCLWYDSIRAFTQGNQQPFQLTGTYPEMKAVAVVVLEDILEDPSDPYGDNYLDKARTIATAGRLYNILGYERDGMAIGLPYLATIVLSGAVGNVET